MKKVFAFLSTLLLTIALVGISAGNSVKASSDKWTVDPTLAEDEIPVYIMDSIMTTFPNYYDNETLPDSYYIVGREYPWNETRLRVAQLNADGTPTGKYYAIYFNGATKAIGDDGNPLVGAGNYIYVWDEDPEDGGKVKTGYYGSYGASYKFNISEGAVSGSLSYMRYNASSDLVEVDTSKSKDTFAVRSAVFNEKGQIIRAAGAGSIYDINTESDLKIAPEYCYLKTTGQVGKYNDVSECMPNLVPEADADGNTTLVDKGPKYIASRFVWEYFEEEPENVNTVPYLSDKWDYKLWDYCYPEGDGYIAIAFCGASYQNKLSEDAINVLREKLMASGKSEKDAQKEVEGYTRDCTNTLRVPAGGWVYVNGYLDQTPANLQAINEIAAYGYKYGRQLLTKKDNDGNLVLDENGEEVKIGMGEVKTYNFSTSGLKFYEKVVDGNSYQLLEGQNVVEIMQGTVFKPATNILYNGVMKYWSVQDDILSFKDASVKEDENSEIPGLFYINVSTNGGASVPTVYPSAYDTFDEMINDFVKDFNDYMMFAHCKLDEDPESENFGKYMIATDGGTQVEYQPLTVPAVGAALSTTDFFYTIQDKIASTNAQKDSFTTNHFVSQADGSNFKTFYIEDEEGKKQTVWEKWSWMFEYINIYANSKTLKDEAHATYIDSNAGNVTGYSRGEYTFCLWGFLTKGPIKASWPWNRVDWSSKLDPNDPNSLTLAEGWIDNRSSLEKWTDYTIDTTTAKPGDNWTLTYTATNTARLDSYGNPTSASMTVKYVVVDSYTPIIEVNENALQYIPRQEGISVVINPIDKYSLVKAYDAQYNGVSILGNDITQNVSFDTDLDFDNPKEGVHKVVATIWNNSHTKQASVTFNVEVVDITKPKLRVRPVTVYQGEDFDFRDAIIYAYDEVSGNLLEASYDWYTVSPAVDTMKVGQQTVTITVYDEKNNPMPQKVVVTVLPNGLAPNEEGNLDSNVSSIKEQVDALKEANSALQNTVDGLSATVDTVLGSTKKVSVVGLVFSIVNVVLVLGLAGTAAYFLFFNKKPALAEEAPAEETPAEEAPVEETPAEEAPVEDAE